MAWGDLGDIPWQQRSPEVSCCGANLFPAATFCFVLFSNLKCLLCRSAAAAVGEFGPWVKLLECACGDQSPN